MNQSSTLRDPSSLQPGVNALLSPVSAEEATAIKLRFDIPVSWECLGATNDLCQLVVNGSIRHQWISLCESPVGMRYYMFSSPNKSASTLVLSAPHHRKNIFMNSLLLTLILPIAAAMEPAPQVLLWEDRARQQMQAAFTSLGNGDLVNAGETIKKIEREMATVSSLKAMETAYSPLQWTPKLNADAGEAW